MDAAHFRTRARTAREMAQAGEDVRLAQMLLEVAADMEAEADAIEAAAAKAPAREPWPVHAAARPASNNSRRNAASPLNFDEIGRCVRASSAS